MRILQVHCSYRTPAGEETVAAVEAELLAARGHEVERFMVKNPAGASHAMMALLVSPHNVAMVNKAREVARAFRPDVIHVHNTWFSLGSAVVPALRSIAPVVMTIHNYRASCIGVDLFRDGAVCTACVGGSSWPGVVHRCYRDSLRLSVAATGGNVYHRWRRTLDRSVTRFIAPSAFMGDRLVEMGFDERRIVIKPHFVKSIGTRTRPPAQSDRVLYVGRLSAGKGVASLLRAWERSTTTDLHLTVVGEGPLESALREAAPRDVDFMGWREHAVIADLMGDSRALVFPSEWYEPFGMVLLEAMAAGLPVVTNDVAAAASIVDPHPDLLAQPGRDDSLMRAIDALRSDDLVEAEGPRMRARYEANFTPEVNAPLLEAIYLDAVAVREI